MLSSLRRSAAVVATGLVAALVVLPPQTAQADTSTLSLTAVGTAEGFIEATYTGTAAAAGYLFSFYQDASIPCAATPSAEANANAAEMPLVEVQPGSFTQQSKGYAYAPGRYRVCGYLAIPSSNPSDPGPRYATPAATASTIVITSPCSDLDTTFTLTHLEAQSTWDSHSKKTIGYGAVSVDVNDPGVLVVTGPGISSGGEALEEGAQTVEGRISDEYSGDGRTKDSEYVFTFYPGTYGSCTMDDGTVRDLGPDGDFHGEPQTLEVTWFIAGQGATGSVDGIVLPGSTTPHEVPSRTPILTGPHTVAEKDTCSVTIPEGEPYLFAWEADGKPIYGKTQTLKLGPDLYGKTVTCLVINNGAHGFPTQESEGFTVAIGTIRNTKLPKIFGEPDAGGAVALDYGKWSPSSVVLKYRYQWYLGTKPVKGATKSNYAIPASAKGKKISCKMTVSSPGFTNASAMSKAVTVR